MWCLPASGHTIYSMCGTIAAMDLNARIAALTAAPLSQSARRHLRAALAAIDRDSQRESALAAALAHIDPTGYARPYALARRIATDIDTLRSRNIARRIALGTRKASDYEQALLVLMNARCRETTLAALIKNLKSS